METYKDINGDSGVESFEVGGDFIKVKFKNNYDIYVYTNDSAGVGNITQMKALALEGDGLNSFILKYVRKRYSHIE